MAGEAIRQPYEWWPADRWREERQRDLSLLRPWVEARLQRSSRGQRHPVYDFLFEYYSYRPSHLLRWSPGWGIVLQGARIEDVGWREFIEITDGVVLPVEAFPAHRVDYLRWAVEYLEAVEAREPAWSCFGLHEWAMVYQESCIRHPYVPLRLQSERIDAFVRQQSLRCTHYDAYRFFTPAARPLNRWELTRSDAIRFDQPACVHVNMDLYRFAYKIAPFCPGSLVAATFDLARRARELDMRASPYDLRVYGLEPICIETTEGRAEYIEAQRQLFVQAQPLRRQLRALYQRLLNDRLSVPDPSPRQDGAAHPERSMWR
ncbi:MAG: 3-methyladenine DNA glycosylase [Thermogemmata sp.]